MDDLLFKQEAQLHGSSKIFGFIDVSEESIDDGSFAFNTVLHGTWEEFRRTLINLDFRWIHLPSDRHQGGSNLSFLDGHVEPHRWKFAPKRLVDPNGFSPVNDLDREDMAWLVKHTPGWQFLIGN